MPEITIVDGLTDPYTPTQPTATQPENVAPAPLETEPAIQQSVDPNAASSSIAPPVPSQASEPVPDPKLPQVDEDDDFSQDLQEGRQALAGKAAIERMDALIGGGGGGAGASAPLTAKDVRTDLEQAEANQSLSQKAGKVAADIGKGLATSPGAVRLGMTDAINETIALSEELSGYKLPKVPKFDEEPDTKTGALIQGVSQFLTGFIGAGKVLKPLKAAGPIAKGVKTMAQGALADFSAFDGHASRLSNLVEEFPALKNPVSEYLKAKPGDSQMEGRFKNAVEGMGLGFAADGLIKAVGMIRMGHYAGFTKKYSGTLGKFFGDNKVKTPREQKLDAFAALGDASNEAPIISRTHEEDKLAAASVATEGMTPSNVMGKGATKEQFINFATMDTPDKIKTTMQKMADAGSAQIDEAKRGKVSWENTKLSAQDEDAWKTLMERRKGEAMNASQTTAARQLWVASGSKLREMAEIAKNSTDPVDLFNFRKMLTVHHAVQVEVMAARTETARALNAWKIPVGEGDGLTQTVIDALKASGGEDLAREMADKVAGLSAAGLDRSISKFAERGALALTRDAFAQYYVNALLSNPVSHAANVLSNMSVAVQQIAERKGAEYIAQKLGTEGGVALGEAAAMMHAMLQTYQESLIAFGKKVQQPTELLQGARDLVWKDPEDFAGTSAMKHDLPTQPLNAEAWGASSETTLGRSIDVVEHATRTSGRLLGHSDNYFKSMAYRMELNAQAVRMASAELKGGALTPELFKQRVAAIVENPPKTVQMEAANSALYMTFQQKPAAVLKKLGDGFQSIPVLGRYFMPFKNTPINIMTYTFERTPLAPFVKQFRADVAAGGGRADIAMSRMATGSMVMTMAMDLAMRGHITGSGPTAKGERDNWLNRGNQPYSLNINGTRFQFSRVDPMGFTLGLAADMAEAMVNAGDEIDEESFEEVFAGGIFSSTENVTNKSYMKGMVELVGAIANPQMNGPKVLRNILPSLVPAGVAAIARANDPVQRTARNTLEALQRRVPFWSEGAAPYRNLWGEQVEFRSPVGWAYDMVSPIHLKTKTPQPIDDELHRIGYYPDLPDRKVSFADERNPAKGSVTIKLDSHQYSRYVELTGSVIKWPPGSQGKTLRERLNDTVTGKDRMWSRHYAGLTDGPDGGKKAFIRKTIDDYREVARRQMLAEDKDIKTQVLMKTEMKPGRFKKR